MDNRILDLEERIEVLENVVFQQQSSLLALGILGCSVFRSEIVLSLVDVSEITIGSLNFLDKEAEIWFFADYVGENDAEFTIKLDDEKICGGKFFANSTGKLHIFVGKVANTGSIVVDFCKSMVGGTITNLRVCIVGKATFAFSES